jgi:redox-sensitive bicupin YhaK (pirin superfamily)
MKTSQADRRFITQFPTIRQVAVIVPGISTEEGEGFIVNRPFPSRTLQSLDPFLMLDELGPIIVNSGEAKGAPSHPHRGFETVSYVLAGQIEHRDSEGNHGVLNAGDVQWMTAGRGVIHSEMPSATFQKSGGLAHSFQIWVNLPKIDKMMKPRYQEIPASQIPEAVVHDSQGRKIRARVIAGQFATASAHIATMTPIELIDFELAPESELTHAIAKDYNSSVYIFEGKGKFGDEQQIVERGNLVVFSSNEGSLVAKNVGQTPLRFLLLAGKPIGEPVAQLGPFVMNTYEELKQAYRDFQTGKFVQS